MPRTAATSRPSKRSAPAANGRAAVQAALLDDALAPVKQELAAVTERMLSHLDDPVARKVAYLVTAGGKRLRPALVLLAGGAGLSPAPKALIDAATAVELIHTATLIHDDIIDGSRLRRAQPAFHQRWGTERAVLMGDYLYATAFSLLAQLRVPGVVEAISAVCQQLCRGELREVEARYRLDLSETEYLDIIRDKTASLIGGCCEVGAILGGCGSETAAHLREFGLRFGLAFQIIDDCLDLAGDPRKMGKSILADLDKGALSLPIIYLTQMLPRGETRKLFAPLRTQATNPAFLRRVAAAAKAAGAIARAQAKALEFAQAAAEALRSAEAPALAHAGRLLAQYVTVRSR
jgi:geranylgeranyl pyrophosphate synthase